MILHRVIGPPGCGKTTYLTRQAKQAGAKYGASGIAICSLTRTAAAEIASRTEGVPRDRIGTLHAHAYRLLDRPTIAQASKTAAQWNRECGNQAWAISGKTNSIIDQGQMEQAFETDGDQLLEEISTLRARIVPEDLWPFRLRPFWIKWSSWKADNGYLDFTDLIVKAIAEVDSLDASVLLADEAQDMSRLEMALVRKWGAAAEQVVIAGDPDQAIYDWRGADPEAFYEGEATSTRILAQSYRVSRAVHAEAVRWIERIADRPDVEYQPTEIEGKVHRHTTLGLKDPAPIVTMIEQIAGAGQSVMVLASCGYMLAPLIKELKDRAIPFHNPYRLTHGGWNPMVGARRLLALLRPDKDVWEKDARLWSWDDVWAFAEPIKAAGNLTRGSKTLLQSKVQTQYRFDTEDDRLLNRFGELAPIFEASALPHLLNLDIHWWWQNLNHKDHLRQKFVHDVALKHGGRVLRERPKVILGTIHSVKGGEADHVILSPDISRAADDQWKQPSGRAGLIRLFYVAMTRARHELHLLGPSDLHRVPLLPG